MTGVALVFVLAVVFIAVARVPTWFDPGPTFPDPPPWTAGELDRMTLERWSDAEDDEVALP